VCFNYREEDCKVQAPGGERTKKKTVLLVEDTPGDVELTRWVAAKSPIPINLVVARDGQEALDLVLSSGAQAEKTALELAALRLLLLDLKLPKVSGLEVLRRLRSDSRSKLIPVVVLSSSNEPEDIAAAYTLGANGYVQKPLYFSEFRSAFDHLLHYWLVLNEPPPASITPAGVNAAGAY
jgi:two-component system response regulator